ncbi:MATE family efflux transporter [Pseudoalteromonas sp. JBTF-M23]|uniref:MATE family efflux transporter n=1 Tax=Pseudoalteromonas caenipelagi TaxID=2726988 RepID=A0A849VJ03_9GAMM|nr:MATE family efflux transporter [Pseudoalteromonas caenipelagi]NOU52638.1 MATE family efflux transporter [Pseudoalteromonas caenipelagi]
MNLNIARNLLIFAFPLIISQGVQILMVQADSISAANISSETLAAISLAYGIFVPVIFFFAGVFSIIPQLIGFADGNKKLWEVNDIAYSALLISLLLPLLFIACYFAYKPLLLDFWSASESVESLATEYLDILMLSLPFITLGFSLRGFLSGLAILNAHLISVIFGCLAKVAYLYLAHQDQGLDIREIAFSTMLANVVILLVLAYKAQGKISSNRKLYHQDEDVSPKFTNIKVVLSKGIPLGIAMLFEVILFTLSMHYISGTSTENIAAYEVTRSLFSIMFIIPSSICIAMSIIISRKLAEAGRREVFQIAKTAAGLLLICMCVQFTILCNFIDYVQSAYALTDSVRGKIEMVIPILMICSVFDLLQYFLIAILRCLKQSIMIMASSIFSYFVMGMFFIYFVADQLVDAGGTHFEALWIAIASVFFLLTITLLFGYLRVQRNGLGFR